MAENRKERLRQEYTLLQEQLDSLLKEGEKLSDPLVMEHAKQMDRVLAELLSLS